MEDRIDYTIGLKEQRDVLITYLKAKTEAQDWHAVSDAANDIRELEALLNLLAELE